MRVAIDAANLPNDRRGMGRIVRGYIGLWLADPSLELTLLGRSAAEERAIGAEFAGRHVRTARAATAGARRAYDCVWFPWNGMRFDAAAPSLLTVNDVFAFTYAHAQAIARWREQGPIRHGARRATRSHDALAVEPRRDRTDARRPGVADHRDRRTPRMPIGFPGRSKRFPSRRAARRTVVAVGLREERKNAGLLVEACARALARAG